MWQIKKSILKSVSKSLLQASCQSNGEKELSKIAHNPCIITDNKVIILMFMWVAKNEEASWFAFSHYYVMELYSIHKILWSPSTFLSSPSHQILLIQWLFCLSWQLYLKLCLLCQLSNLSSENDVFWIKNYYSLVIFAIMQKTNFLSSSKVA